jgi:superfamily I DNA/RNA helicase
MQQANFKTDLVEKFLEMAKNVEIDQPGLAGMVDALHLDEPRFERSKDKDKGVQIMTMHAAKGLEFPFVFIVGAEENIIPHERSIDVPNGVEEERRLFYVAITRAKKKLFISHCGFRSRSGGSAKREPTPSRFLSNVPEKFLENSVNDLQSEEARRMAAAKRLFEMFR